MDQVSRPIQVALVATLAFAVLWFLALRPKEEEIPPAPKPPAQPQGQSGNSALPGGLGNAVDKARAGQAQANQSAQQRSQQGAGSEEPGGQPPAQQSPPQAQPTPSRPTPSPRAPSRSRTPTPGPVGRAVGANPASPNYLAGVQFGQAFSRQLFSAGPAVSSPTLALTMLAMTLGQAGRNAAPQPAAAATPAPRTAVPATPAGSGRRLRASVTPAQVNSALGAGKVVVLLFYNRSSSDDRAVRAELAGLARRRGRVLVGEAPLREVSRFPSVTQGVQILQSPTVVVIDRRRQAELLVGYTDRFELDQLVVSALAGR